MCLVSFCSVSDDFNRRFVVVVDDLFSVVHAALTDFYGVTVENFSKFVA